MTSGFTSPPKWVRGATGEPATILAVWDGVPSVFLAPAFDGAILWWQFDVDDEGSDYILLAHLTEGEAQAVFTSGALENPLEPIRANISDNHVIIARRRAPTEGGESVQVFEMPREYTADQFADWLNEITDVLGGREKRGGAYNYFVHLPGFRRVWDFGRDPTAVAMDKIAATVLPA